MQHATNYAHGFFCARNFCPAGVMKAVGEVRAAKLVREQSQAFRACLTLIVLRGPVSKRAGRPFPLVPSLHHTRRSREAFDCGLIT